MERSQLLIDLMKGYGRLGVKSWNTVKQPDRNTITRRLGWQIAQHPAEVDITIETHFIESNLETNRSKHRFIPISSTSVDFMFAFFLPIRERVSNSIDKFSFDLFLFVDQENCLGFRWEPADKPSSRHSYGHIQMCRTLVRKYAEPGGIPKWIPDSFPAIPISTSDPLRMFLSLSTSIHGYGEDMSADLKEIIPEGWMRQTYAKEWKDYLFHDVIK